MAAKVRKGDYVQVLAGRDRGKAGEVLKVIPKESRVIVQGVNMTKRHRRPGPGNPTGGIEERESPIHVSNVAHRDPGDNKPTRVGFKILEGERKVRFAKRSGEVIDR